MFWFCHTRKFSRAECFSLPYSFGLPVVATDVGSFREEIVEGSTGFLCQPGDPAELAKAIEKYFTSDLYRNLKVRRQELKDYANANHSWNAVADLTRNAYAQMSSRTAAKPSRLEHLILRQRQKPDIDSFSLAQSAGRVLLRNQLWCRFVSRHICTRVDWPNITICLFTRHRCQTQVSNPR